MSRARHLFTSVEDAVYTTACGRKHWYLAGSFGAMTVDCALCQRTRAYKELLDPAASKGDERQVVSPEPKGREITHRVVEGRFRQVVSPERLREVLDQDGETTEPPPGFGPGDEWDVAD